MAELAAMAAGAATFFAENAAAISAITTVASTGVTAAGTIAAGKQQEAAAKFEAQQLEMRAKEEQAAAQREAEQYRRKKDMALSTLQARSASSGFTATDPTTLAIADEIARYGTMQEQMAMYGGKSRRAGNEAQAQAARMEGAAARQGSYYSAAGTILGGISTVANRLNKPTPSGGSFRYG